MARVLCLGEILVDRISTESQKESQGAYQSYAGGATANVACALAKLGTEAGFIGCVGQDQIGQELLSTLNQAGVDTSGVQIHPQAVTREVYVKRDRQGERSFSHFSGDATTVFADTQLTAEFLPNHIFAEADFLVLGTLALGHPISAKAVGRALKLAEQNFVKVVVDINWRQIFWQDPSQAPQLIQVLLSHCDILKATAAEAQWLFRTTSPAAIAQMLPDLEGVLITNGAADCRYYFGDHQGILPTFAVQAIDTTGAGDGFLAGFLHQLSQRSLSALRQPQQVQAMVSYACAVGALTTLKLGAIAAQPTEAEVQAFLASQDQQVSS